MATIPYRDWLRMVEAMGPDAAEVWRQQQGIEIDQGMPSAMPDPGAEPPMGALEMPVEQGMDFSPVALQRQLAELQRDELALQRGQADYRKQMFEQGRRTLEAQKRGPSRAEQLFALSAAFAAPQRYKGFGGMMANVAPTLADLAAAKRGGQEDYDERLLRLQQQYMSGEMEGERGSLAARRQLLQTAAQLGKEPKRSLVVDPLGRGVIDKDTQELMPFRGGAGGDAPQVSSPEEAARLGPGATWRAPDGSIRRNPGGPTGSAPSGGFRP